MSGAIRLEVMRKRRDAAAAQAAADREQRARNESHALQRESAARLDQAWEQFSASIDELIRNAKGEAGPMGPMPDHEWNKDRSRVRFQRQNDDGETEWGPWSRDLRGASQPFVSIASATAGSAASAPRPTYTQALTGTEVVIPATTHGLAAVHHVQLTDPDGDIAYASVRVSLADVRITALIDLTGYTVTLE